MNIKKPSQKYKNYRSFKVKNGVFFTTIYLNQKYYKKNTHESIRVQIRFNPL